MSFFNSLNNKSKQFESPFKHWELNEPLTTEAISEITNADIAKDILSKSNVDIIPADDLKDAAEKAVKVALKEKV